MRCASLMDICHLKNSELEPKCQKYKGRVVLRGDTVKLKILKSECPDIWRLQPKHKWPKSWSSMEDPVVPLERNLYGHPLAGLLWERQFEKVLYSLTEKRTILVCVPFHRKLKQLLFFFSEGINQVMQLEFLAPVDLFF